MLRWAATRLAYEAMGFPTQAGEGHQRPLPLDCLPAGAVCHLCGGEARYGVRLHIGRLALDNFTDWVLAAAPNSPWLCDACLYVLKDPRFRTHSTVVSQEGVSFLSSSPADLKELWKHILSPPEPPFAITVVGRQNRKHVFLRARVNLSREAYYLQYREQGLYVSTHQLQSVAESFLRQQGRPRAGDRYDAGDTVDPVLRELIAYLHTGREWVGER